MSEIILEGFHYLSAVAPRTWFAIIHENALRIQNLGATIVWFPPISQSHDNMGYTPTRWYRVSDVFGGETALISATQRLRDLGIKCMADVVLNHRSGIEGTADTFEDPPMSPECIVGDDDYLGGKRSNTDEEVWRGRTCFGFDDSRDLNHRSAELRSLAKDYLRFFKRLGFTCWRYDMVSGFHPSHIDEYNGDSKPEFSVGEYWDNDKQIVTNWIDDTSSNPRYRSCAFDFPLREMLIRAVTYGEYYLLNAYGKLNGVIGYYPEKAVTFVENHDTDETRADRYAKPLLWNKTLQAHAFILTHPGTPCIYWPDVFDGGSINEETIRHLITLRKNYGITSTSAVDIDTASNFYAAYVMGNHGVVALKIGPGWWSPSRYGCDGRNPVISGDDWAVWGSSNNGPETA